MRLGVFMRSASLRLNYFYNRNQDLGAQAIKIIPLAHCASQKRAARLAFGFDHTPMSQASTSAIPLPDGEDREVARLTYRYDRLRAFFYGMLEPGWVTFALIIAIRYYEMPDYLKALLPAASFIGLFLNAFSASLASKTGQPVAKILAFMLLMSAMLIVLAILAPSLAWFLTFFIAANICIVQSPPLMIQIYSLNYRPGERGKKLASVLILTSLGGVFAGVLGGKALDHDVSVFPFILAGMALSCVLCALIIRRIPSQPLNRASTANPLKSFSVIWEDKLFGWLLFCWMVIGVTNLLTIPLRVEYMADPQYGINANNYEISVVTFVVPMVMRMLSTRVWGYLFDRINFILWRVLVNSCFLVAFLIYFNSTSLFMLGLGMGFVGLAMGGGNLGWTLWVTKLAPSEKVSTYMSAHTALTGLRGTAAPFLGYWALSNMTPHDLSLMTAGLLMLANLLFATAWRSPRMRKLS